MVNKMPVKERDLNILQWRAGKTFTVLFQQHRNWSDGCGAEWKEMEVIGICPQSNMSSIPAQWNCSGDRDKRRFIANVEMIENFDEVKDL